MFKFLQRIARSLLLPLAILPVAVLLMVLGAPGSLGVPIMVQAGVLMLQHISLFFAMSIALSLTSRRRGLVALGVLIGYILVLLAAQAVYAGISYLSGTDVITQPYVPEAIVGIFFLFCYGLIFVLVRALELRTPERKYKARPLRTVAEVDDLAQAYVQALGGEQNVVAVTGSSDRLRVQVNDTALVNNTQLSLLGARGIVKQSATAVQVIVGSDAEAIVYAMRGILPVSSSAAAPVTAPAAAPGDLDADQTDGSPRPERAAQAASPIHDPAIIASVSLMIDALGGAANILEAQVTAATRLRVTVEDPDLVDEEALHAAGAGGVMALGSTFHILLGNRAQSYSEEMQARLADEKFGS